MKNLLIVLIILGFVGLMILPQKKESQPPVEYYTASDPGPSLKNITIASPDEVQKIIQLTQVKLSEQIGECTYCIETSNLELTDNVYSARLLFMVLVGFAYGVAVDATISKGPNGPEKVLTLTLQSTKTADEVDIFDQFVSGADIESPRLPTKAELQSVVNNL
jgi:hypothetical protein